MRQHSQIVREAGKPETVAEACGSTVPTVRSWMQRDSIPAPQWATFAAKGWATLEELALAAANNQPRSAEAGAAT